MPTAQGEIGGSHPFFRKGREKKDGAPGGAGIVEGASGCTRSPGEGAWGYMGRGDLAGEVLQVAEVVGSDEGYAEEGAVVADVDEEAGGERLSIGAGEGEDGADE